MSSTRERAPRSFRHGRAASVAALAWAALLAVAPLRADPVGAAPAQPSSIDVTSVSPWVPADGDFRVEMRVTGDVPADAVVRTSIHQRLRPSNRSSLREVLDGVFDGDTPPNLLQSPTVRPLAELGDPRVGVVLDLPVRSTRSQPDDRTLLPASGIHPVTIDVLAPGGARLATTTVFLNHLPSPAPTTDGGGPLTMSVALTTVVDGPAAIDPSGRARLSAEARDALTTAAALLSAVPQAPLTVAIRPTLLDALARSTDAADRKTLQSIQDAFRVPGHAFAAARVPYVAVDTGGLSVATGGSGELLREVALADRTLRSALATEPVGTTWLDDPTVTTPSLGLLQGLGATRLVIGADRMRITTRGTSSAALTTRSVHLTPSGPSATAPDAEASARLTAEGVPAGLRANQATTALMAAWFTAIDTGADSGAPVAVLPVPASTGIAAVQALIPAFSAPGPLVADPTAAPPTAGTGDERAASAELTARPTPDQGPAVRAVLDTRRLVDGFRSLAPASTTETAEWELLAAQTLDRSMSLGERTRYHARIRSSIERLSRRVEMPKERRVLLTSRRSTIPLRFRNGLPYDVTLLLRVRSGRLDIGGGQQRTVVLHPGQNLIDLPVTSRAPGGTLLRIDATSPDGAIVLPSVAIPVTSSTISGVGAALSVLSLGVLGGWWLLSFRRDRRERRRHERADRRRSAVERAVAEGADGHDGDSADDEGADSVIRGG